MIEYRYRCTNCENEFDVKMSIKDKPLKKCKLCNKKTLERIIFSPQAFVRQEVKTIGQLAERNAKKLGKDEVQERELKNKDQTKEAMKQARKELNAKLGKMNDTQRNRFIQDGRI